MTIRRGTKSTYFWVGDYGSVVAAFDAACRLEDAILDAGHDVDMVALRGQRPYTVGYRVDEAQYIDLSNESLMGVRVA